MQALAAVSIMAWSAGSSLVILKVLDLCVGLRVPLQQEVLGADVVQHGVGAVRYVLAMVGSLWNS